jgi:predicted O-methyltransferase YrrM
MAKNSPLSRALLRIRTKALGFHPHFPILRPVDTNGVEILADLDFQRSCREIEGLTLLDTPRLANLWQLCRMSNPAGSIIEVGSFKGGGALHLSNSSPERRVYICDSFQGFEKLDAKLDRSFTSDQFKNTTQQAVERLFEARNRNFQVVAGFFPQSCADIDLGPISFAHLDADTYESTLQSLEFLVDKLTDRSLLLLDDFRRRAEGVDTAVREFTSREKSLVAFPIFSGQGLLVHRSWFA